MALTEKDLSYSLSVARRMVEIAIQEHNVDNVQAEKFFLVGMIHLLGKEFEEGDNATRRYGWLLRQSGFDFWRDIAYQDDADTSYNSLIREVLQQAKREVSEGYVVGV